MERATAEQIVCEALEVEQLPDISLRQFLRERLGREPRHADLFALLARVRALLGYGGITMEEAERILRPAHLVDYVSRMRPPPNG